MALLAERLVEFYSHILAASLAFNLKSHFVIRTASGLLTLAV